MINYTMEFECPYKRRNTMVIRGMLILCKVGWDCAPVLQSQQAVTELLETCPKSHLPQSNCCHGRVHPTCLKLPQASLSEFYDASEMKFYCILPPPLEKPQGRKEKQNPPRGTSRPVRGGELATHKAAGE